MVWTLPMLTESQAHLTFWKVQIKVMAAELKVRSCPRQMFCVKDYYFFLSRAPPPTCQSPDSNSLGKPQLQALSPGSPLQGDPCWLIESRELSLTGTGQTSVTWAVLAN